MGKGILLEMDNITKQYPGVKALDNVQFRLNQGEVHTLVGENGAGKSTLIKILMGIVKKNEGTIRINGKDVEINNPFDAASLGVAAVFQELSQIPHLTVAENVFLGKEKNVSGNYLNRKKMNKMTQEILDLYGIDELRPEDLIQNLPTAKRQLAEIVKAISIKPKILILDEPTSSLTEKETAKLFKIVNQFRSEGIGIIYISHRMEELKLLADRITILRDGTYIGEYPMTELSMDEIVTKMVGRDIEINVNRNRIISRKPENILLQVKNFCQKDRFKNINFEVYKGEVLGIAGLVGSGRSELMQAVFGVGKCDSGEIILEQENIKIACVKDALKNGIAMVPESRHLQGLVLKHSVKENLILPTIKSFTNAGVLNKRKMNEFAEECIQKYGIKTETSEKTANQLSGGNQQKIVIAKWLAANPKLLIVDEPTVGIDIRSKTEIHNWIQNLADQGVAVIMISSEMPELLANSDRVIVMNDNKIIATLEETTQEEIMSLILEDKNKSSKE